VREFTALSGRHRPRPALVNECFRHGCGNRTRPLFCRTAQQHFLCSASSLQNHHSNRHATPHTKFINPARLCALSARCIGSLRRHGRTSSHDVPCPSTRLEPFTSRTGEAETRRSLWVAHKILSPVAQKMKIAPSRSSRPAFRCCPRPHIGPLPAGERVRVAVALAFLALCGRHVVAAGVGVFRSTWAAPALDSPRLFRRPP